MITATRLSPATIGAITNAVEALNALADHDEELTTSQADSIHDTLCRLADLTGDKDPNQHSLFT